MNSPRDLVELLAHAHATGELIEHLDPASRPNDLAHAYAIAERLTATRGALAGWKVGATSLRGQQFLGLSEPFFGRIFANTLKQSPAVLHAASTRFALEAEIAFRIGHDLPARREPYLRAEVSAAIAGIAPALEINRPSYAHPFDVGGLALIADNGVNVGACLGTLRRDWQAVDLTSVTTWLRCGAAPAIAGTSAAVLGDPLIAVTWLANALSRRGLALRAGEWVLSGAMTPPMDAEAGQRIRAEFGALGNVELTLMRGQ